MSSIALPKKSTNIGSNSTHAIQQLNTKLMKTDKNVTAIDTKLTETETKLTNVDARVKKIEDCKCNKATYIVRRLHILFKCKTLIYDSKTETVKITLLSHLLPVESKDQYNHVTTKIYKPHLNKEVTVGGEKEQFVVPLEILKNFIVRGYWHNKNELNNQPIMHYKCKIIKNDKTNDNLDEHFLWLDLATLYIVSETEIEVKVVSVHLPEYNKQRRDLPLKSKPSALSHKRHAISNITFKKVDLEFLAFTHVGSPRPCAIACNVFDLFIEITAFAFFALSATVDPELIIVEVFLAIADFVLNLIIQEGITGVQFFASAASHFFKKNKTQRAGFSKTAHDNLKSSIQSKHNGKAFSNIVSNQSGNASTDAVKTGISKIKSSSSTTNDHSAKLNGTEPTQGDQSLEGPPEGTPPDQEETTDADNIQSEEDDGDGNFFTKILNFIVTFTMPIIRTILALLRVPLKALNYLGLGQLCLNLASLILQGELGIASIIAAVSATLATVCWQGDWNEYSYLWSIINSSNSSVQPHQSTRIASFPGTIMANFTEPSVNNLTGPIQTLQLFNPLPGCCTIS